MANSINIDSLKSGLFNICMRDDLLLEFFIYDIASNSGTYQCLKEMLLSEYDNIAANLTQDNINNLESLTGHKLKLSPGSIKVSELKEALGEIWGKKDLWKREKSKGYFGVGSAEVFRFRDINDILSQESIVIYSNISSVKDDAIIDSISELIDSIMEINNEEKRNELLLFFDGLRSSIDNSKGEIDKFSINDKFIRIEEALRHITKHFIYSTKTGFLINKVKNPENGTFYSERDLKQLIDGCEFSQIIHIIKTIGNKDVGPHLNILRILRNKIAHLTSNVTKPEDRYRISCFLLCSIIGSFYTTRKKLLDSDAYTATTCNEKIFSIYFNNNLRAGISEEVKDCLLSALPKIKLFKDIEISPRNAYSSHIEYTILKDEKYRLEFGEGDSKLSIDVPTESFWRSPSNRPVAIWTGVQPYFFTDISAIYSELNPYIQNANKEDIDALTNLAEVLNQLVSNLGDKIEANIEILTKAINKIDETLNKINRTLITTNEGVKILIEQGEKAQKDNKETKKGVNRMSYATMALCILLAIALGLYVYKEFSHDSTPKSYLIEGDAYLKEHKAEKAGEAYRKAIGRYETIIKTDSNNIEANISLATMLMRGKGKYDLEQAERCAKRASSDKRGQGLYAYLLMRNGKYKEASNCLKTIHNLDDEYAKLTDAVLTIYGMEREQNIESILKADSIIAFLPIQEAALEKAFEAYNGVPNNDIEGSYFITPDPMLGLVAFSNLVRDSLSIQAMTYLSDFSSVMGDFGQAYTLGYAAFAAGMNKIAPMLIIQTLHDIDIERSDASFAKEIEELSRIAEQDNSFLTDLSRFSHSLYNYYHERLGVTAKQLVEDLDSVISKMEDLRDEELLTILDNLYTIRVSLCLQSGDMTRATHLAMKLDKCNDSIAISNYLLGVSFARGYGNIPIDSVASRKYISKAARLGYNKAIYTQLKYAKPLEYKIVTSKDWSRAYSLSYSEDLEVIKEAPRDSVTNEPIGFAEGEACVTYIGGTPIMKTNSDGTKTFYTFEYNASKYALVSDSIWQSSPELAMELADYWRDFYYPWPIYESISGEEMPYLPYCPKEYQVMCNTISTCYEYGKVDDKDGLRNRQLPQTILEYQMSQLQIALSSALKHRNGEMARHLITMWLTLAVEYGIEGNVIQSYEDFADLEYKSEKHFNPYRKIDYPMYLY